jgi:hypothetical protein
MKLSITAVFAWAAVFGGPLSAQACNPMLGRDYGKHVSPTVMPAAMLAKNAGIGSPRSIVGLWHDIHTASDGTLFLEGYDTWNRSGTEYELGNLPPAGGNLCVGVWKTYGDTVELTAHVAWVYDLNSNYVGTLDFTEKNKVSANGNIYTGTFDARFFNPTGGLIQEIKGTTSAERLGQ